MSANAQNIENFSETNAIEKKLQLSLEALSMGEVQRANEHLYELQNNPSIDFFSYDIKALEYFIGETRKTKDTLEASGELIKSALQTICDLWQLDSRKPYLALKAYAISNNKDGVQRVIDNVKNLNNRAFTGETPLVDCLHQDCPEIVELLIKRGAINDTSSLRVSLSRAAKLGHLKSLKTLLKLTPSNTIDPSMLRDAANSAILGNQLECYKSIVKTAKTNYLEIWFNQVKHLHQEGIKDKTKPDYTKEYQVLKTEIAKREIVQKLRDKDLQSLSL